MPSIDEILAQIESLISSVKPLEAEDRLRSVLGTMGAAEDCASGNQIYAARSTTSCPSVAGR